MNLNDPLGIEDDPLGIKTPIAEPADPRFQSSIPKLNAQPVPVDEEKLRKAQGIPKEEWDKLKTAPYGPPRQMGFFETLISPSANVAAAKNAASAVGKGVVGVAEGAVGLADIPTLGAAGKVLNTVTGFDPAKAKEVIGGMESESLKRQRKNVEDAKGFSGTVMAMLRNPETISSALGESLPSMLGGAAAAKSLPGVISAASRGAIGEGLVTAGQQAEQTRQGNESGYLDPGQASLALASGAATGLISVLGSKLAGRLGLEDIDTLLAGGASKAEKRGILMRVLGGAVTEGAFEEFPQSMQEAIAANLAAGKPWNEGVVEQGVQGMMVGIMMGAGGNVPGPIRGAKEVPPQMQGPLATGAVLTPRQPEGAQPPPAAEAPPEVQFPFPPPAQPAKKKTKAEFLKEREDRKKSIEELGKLSADLKAQATGVMSQEQALQHATGELLDLIEEKFPGSREVTYEIARRQQAGEELTPDETAHIANLNKSITERATKIREFQIAQAKGEEVTTSEPTPPKPPASPTAPETPAPSGVVEVPATDVFQAAENWDRTVRHGRTDAWFEGGQIDDAARAGFTEALANGGDTVQAHGMAKEWTLGSAIKNLSNLLTNGLDPNRRGGQLDTAPLVNKPGEGLVGATASGSAYNDGPFMLLAKDGTVLDSMDNVAAILVNQANADLVPQIRAHFQKIRPGIIVESYADAGKVVQQIKSKPAQPLSPTPSKSKPITPKYSTPELTTKFTDDQFTITGKNGEMVSGYFRNQDFPNEGSTPTRGEVFLTEVPEALRNQGIGFRMTVDAINLIRANGGKTINLHATSDGGKAIVSKLIKQGIISDPIRVSKTGKAEYSLSPTPEVASSKNVPSPEVKPVAGQSGRFDGIISLAADSPAKLRASDVDRVMSEVGNNPDEIEAFRKYLLEKGLSEETATEVKNWKPENEITIDKTVEAIPPRNEATPTGQLGGMSGQTLKDAMLGQLSMESMKEDGLAGVNVWTDANGNIVKISNEPQAGLTSSTIGFDGKTGKLRIDESVFGKGVNVEKLKAQIESAINTQPAKPAEVKPFEVDEQVVMRSPHTGEDVVVSYRGKPADGQAVVWTGKTQMQIPEAWLRHQGEKYEEKGQSVKPVEQPRTEAIPPKAEPVAPSSPESLSKAKLVDELAGPTPSNYAGKVKWEDNRKAIARFTKDELVRRVTNQRKSDADFKRLHEEAGKIFPEIKAGAEAAGNRWKTYIQERAEQEGVAIPNLSGDRGDAAYTLAKNIASKRINAPVAQTPTPASKPVKQKPTGLTDADGLLYSVVEGYGKLPAFIPDGIHKDAFLRLLKKWNRGSGILTGKEKAQLERLRKIFPDDYEDVFGPKGETFRKAYDLAKKAGIALDIFGPPVKKMDKGALQHHLDFLAKQFQNIFKPEEIWGWVEGAALRRLKKPAKPGIELKGPASKETFTVATVPNGATVKARWRVVSAASLSPILQRDVGADQTRQRANNRNSTEQQANIARNTDPDLLLDSPTSMVGAPVVTSDAVLAGNGRAGGIIAGYEGNTKSIQTYRARVVQRAAELGLGDVSNIPDPVLVREVTEHTRGDREQFVRDSNPQRVGMVETVAEAALLDAQALGDMSALEFAENGNLTAASVRAAHSLLSAANRGIQTDLKGQPDIAEATRRVQVAALAKLAKDSGVDISDFIGLIESEGGRRSLAELVRFAPGLQGLDADLALGGDAVVALRELQRGVSAVKGGAVNSLEEWLANRQQELLQSELTREQEDLLRLFAAGQKKPTLLKEFFTDYIKEAKNEQNQRAESKQSGDIFGGERKPVSGEAIRARALKTVGQSPNRAEGGQPPVELVKPAAPESNFLKQVKRNGVIELPNGDTVRVSASDAVDGKFDVYQTVDGKREFISPTEMTLEEAQQFAASHAEKMGEKKMETPQSKLPRLRNASEKAEPAEPAAQRPVADEPATPVTIAHVEELNNEPIGYVIGVGEGGKRFTLWRRTISKSGKIRHDYLQNLGNSKDSALLNVQRAIEKHHKEGGDVVLARKVVDTRQLGEDSINPSLVMRFGKFNGRPVESIPDLDMSYALWLAKTFSGDRDSHKNTIAKTLLADERVQKAIEEQNKAAENLTGELETTNKQLEPFNVKAVVKNGEILLTGETFNVKDLVKEHYGRWNSNEQGWTFSRPENFKAFADAVIKRGGGTGERLAGSIKFSAEGARLGAIRDANAARPDESGISQDDVSQIISPETKALLLAGEKAGIPKEIIGEQIEDAARIVRSQETGKPMIILGSDPGSGKTFVLGAAIRELLKRGVKKITYVTMNQGLIGQIKADLKAFGVEGVDFITYAGLREAPVTANDVMIFDEAHNIKNIFDSQQGLKAQKLLKQSKFTIFSTATPFENPTETSYLDVTGVFDEYGGWKNFAKAYGAQSRVLKDGTEIVFWKRDANSNSNQVAAREFFRKQGMLAQRDMKIDPKMTDVRLEKVHADEKWASFYNDLLDSIEEAAPDTSKDGNPKFMGHDATWIVNFQKRILEASKVKEGIRVAREALARGRQVVIFVETKAERVINVQDMIDRNAEWNAAKAAALMQDERPPTAKEFGALSDPLTDLLRAMQRRGHDVITIESAEDVIKNALGEDNVAIYTGSVTDAKAQKNLLDWRDKNKKVLVATMAKGGTGLSLHDKIGDRPTTQVNINLPWKATGFKQVSGRTTRYGMRSKSESKWLFSDNIPFDQMLAGRVGGRLQDMGAIVNGAEHIKLAKNITDFNWDSEADEIDNGINTKEKPSSPDINSGNLGKSGMGGAKPSEFERGGESGAQESRINSDAESANIFEMDEGDLTDLFEEQFGDFEGSPQAGEFGRRRGEYTFPTYEKFKEWMDARYAERDLEGMKLAFAEADTAFKVRYVKENLKGDPHLKGWITHIATGAELPAGDPPVPRTTPRPTATGTGTARPAAPPRRPTTPGEPPRPPRNPSIYRKFDMTALVQLLRQYSKFPVINERLRKAYGRYMPASKLVELKARMLWDMELAERVLAHEIGHFIDFAIPLIGKGKQFAAKVAPLWDFRKMMFTKADLKNDARALSRDWRGNFPDGDKYRDTANELFADFLSAMFNKPEWVNQTYPRLYDAFQALRDAKPGFKYAYREIEAWLQGETMARELLDQDKKAVNRTVEILSEEKKKQKASMTDRMAFSMMSLWQRAFQKEGKPRRIGEAITEKLETSYLWAAKKISVWTDDFLKSVQPMLDKVSKDGLEAHSLLLSYSKAIRTIGERRAAGVWIEQNPDESRQMLKNILELDVLLRLKFSRDLDSASDDALYDLSARIFREIHDRGEKFVERMAKEIDAMDLGIEGNAALMAFNVRGKLLNPGGITPETAQKIINQIESDIGKDRFDSLKAAAEALRDLMFQVQMEMRDAGLISEKTWKELIEPNQDSYLPYAVLDYFDGRVRAGVMPQKGTAKDVADVVASTQLKVSSAYIWLQKQRQVKLLKEAYAKGGGNAEVGRKLKRASDIEQIRKQYPMDDISRAVIWVDGVPHLIEFPGDPGKQIENALDLPSFYEHIEWLHAGSKFSHQVMQLYTQLSPRFLLYRNIVRGFRTAGLKVGLMAASRQMKPANMKENLRLAKNYADAAFGEPMLPEVRALVESEVLPPPHLAAGYVRDLPNMRELLLQGALPAFSARKLRLELPDSRGALSDKARKAKIVTDKIFTAYEAFEKIYNYKAALARYGDPVLAGGLARRGGIPKPGVGGKWSGAAEILFPWTRVRIQGMRSGYDLTRDPRTRKGFLARFAIFEGAPRIAKVAIATAVAGKLIAWATGGGDDDKEDSVMGEVFRRISPYKMALDDVVPMYFYDATTGKHHYFWEFKKGSDVPKHYEVVSLRIPSSEEGQVFGTMLYNAMVSVPGAKEKLATPGNGAIENMGQWALNYLTPALNPMFETTANLTDMTIRGRNPDDSFRGKPAANPLLFDAGGAARAQAIAGYTLNQLGGPGELGAVLAANAGLLDDRALDSLKMRLAKDQRPMVEKVPFLGAAVSHDNYGQYRVEKQGAIEEKRTRARARLVMPKKARDLYDFYYRNLNRKDSLSESEMEYFNNAKHFVNKIWGDTSSPYSFYTAAMNATGPEGSKQARETVARDLEQAISVFIGEE